MKKVILFLLMISIGNIVYAQGDKYVKAMLEKIPVVDTTYNPAILLDVSAAFERIANAEKNKWLPYYYAALAQTNAGYGLTEGNTQGGLASKIDPLADKAEQLLNKAEELSKENSEIYVLKKMIASLRLMADPMNRYMQFGPVGQKAIENARLLNPDNPRIYLLLGQDLFYTPEQYGGNKVEARKMLDEAMKKFDSFKPASDLDPTWGRGIVEFMLKQFK